MASPVAYTPGPHEQAYYQGLFQMADTSRTGNITGGDAVALFSRSKLQVDTLKNIWTLADQPASSSLDHRKFAIAIRLIQLAQNGQKAQGPNLAAPPGVVLRPAFFEGITGITIQAPPEDQVAASQPPPSSQKVPTMDQYAIPASPQPQYAQPQQPQYAQPQPPQYAQPQPPQYAQPQPQPPQYAQPQPQPPRYAQPQPPRYAQPQPPQQTQSPQQTGSQYASPAQRLQQPQAPVPSVLGLPPPSMSMALTPQDPYTLTPQEQQRYEGLFQQYQKPDGYIYGPEAVALFSKSEVSTENLRDIWNMVDTSPVDNRLDKLEFAMAMHLIVCIAKKNLPCPSKLPYSLKVLKTATGEALPALAVPQTQDAPLVMPALNHNTSPPMQSAQVSVLSAPPPLPKTSTAVMDISDAFEGLDSGSRLLPLSGFGGLSSTPSYVLGAPTQTHVVETVDEQNSETFTERELSVAGFGYGETTETASSAGVTHNVAPMQIPSTTQELAQNYNLGDSHSELGKLQAVLQKLQAENISLRAQVGSMTEDEKDVHKQIGATVEEISKLSSELTTLRAQVLSTKSKLLESTAELQAGRQKKEVLSDLIKDTRATKEALSIANDDINGVLYTPASAVAAVNPVSNVDNEEGLLGYDSGPTSFPAAASSFSSGPPTSYSYDDTPDVWDVSVTTSFGQNVAPGPAPFVKAIPPQPFQTGMSVPHVPSYEEDGIMGGPSGSNLVEAPAPAPKSPSSPPIHTNVSAQDVNLLKSQALAAEQAYLESKETLSALNAEADKLREVADEAEADARAKQDKATKQGRGLVGGKKKKANKEAEVALAEAAAKRKHFMEMQSQATNAQANVEELQLQATRFLKEFEQAEFNFSSADSGRMSQPVTPSQSYGASASIPSQTHVTGFPNYGVDPLTASSAFGTPADTGFGNGAPITVYSGSFEKPNPDFSGGFGAGVMGGGSFGGGGGIPTPPRASSPPTNDSYNQFDSTNSYDNPF